MSHVTAKLQLKPDTDVTVVMRMSDHYRKTADDMCQLEIADMLGTEQRCVEAPVLGCVKGQSCLFQAHSLAIPLVWIDSSLLRS